MRTNIIYEYIWAIVTQLNTQMVDYLRENLSGFDYFLDFDEWVL